MSLMLSVADRIGDLFLEKIDTAASRKIRKCLTGDPEKKALVQCVKTGVLCMLQAWECQDRDDLETLEKVLVTFFKEPDVSRELVGLLTGKDGSDDDLNEIFTESSTGIDWPDELDFGQGLHVFKAAFLASAVAEDNLQALIQTGNLFEQTSVLKAILEALGTLADLMKKLDKHTPSQINAENVVSGVQLIIQSVGPRIPENKLEAVYLHAFCDQCDAVDLSITDDKYTHDKDHAVCLSQVFMRLYLDGITHFDDEPVAEVIKNVPRDPRSRHKDERPLSVTAIEAIDALDRLVITGQPGGGKSTLVNYLFVQLAQARLQSQPVKGWTGPPLLPVRIILRKFAKWIPDDTKTGQAGLIWDYIEHMVTDKEGQVGSQDVFRYVRKTLKQEGGIVFFDGLDEVGYGDEVSKRDVIKQAVTEVSSQLKKAKIIITSRPYAYRSKDSWRLPESEFPVVNLALFNKEQVKEFVKTWYQQVGKTVKCWDDTRCNNTTLRFYNAVDTREKLFEIVRNPLLLTMAVQLNSRDRLPKRRAELYKNVIALLLARWENNIVQDSQELTAKLSSELILRLEQDTEKLRKTISRVAFNCHVKQRASGSADSDAADISKGELWEELDQDFGVESSGFIIEYIQYRTGILQGKDNRTFSFMHRTFQEYLAARHIFDQDGYVRQINTYLKKDLDWWQEVFLLMAGHVEDRRASTVRDLIEPLLGEKQDICNFSTERDFKKLWLAAQTLWETDYLNECDSGNPSQKQFFDRIHRCLKQGLLASEQLGPKKRAAAGRWLSRLGDDRLAVIDSGHMAFCPVAKGDFWLGDGKDDDCPETLCKELDYDYWLGQYPVTVAQFRQFFEAGGYQNIKYWPEAQAKTCWREPGEVKFWQDTEWRKGMPELPSGFAYDNHPMILISWYEGLAYCRWLTDLFKSGEVGNQQIAALVRENWQFSLPSEIEWEKAGRGPAPSKRLYPSGDEITSNHANYSKTDLSSTSSVGCFPSDESPFHCMDMTGNVWEWCRNKYSEDSSGRVFRGGGWDLSAEDCRCSYRGRIDPDFRNFDLGFRVVLVPSSRAQAGERSEP